MVLVSLRISTMSQGGRVATGSGLAAGACSGGLPAMMWSDSFGTGPALTCGFATPSFNTATASSKRCTRCSRDASSGSPSPNERLPELVPESGSMVVSSYHENEVFTSSVRWSIANAKRKQTHWSFLKRAGFARFGKISRNRLGDLAGCGPLGAAQQGRDEADAAHAAQIMSHGSVEDAALAVGHGPDHGLMFAGAALALIGIGGGQQVNIFDRTAHAVVQLILGVHPFLGHALGNRMTGIADHDFESVLGTMAGARPLSFRHSHFLAFFVQGQARAEIIVAVP